MSTTIEWNGADRSRWVLNGREGPWLPAEGIDGLVASGEDQVVQSLRAGQRARGVAIEPMRGTLLLRIRGDADRSPEEVYRAFRASFSRHKSGRLVVTTGRGATEARCRLDAWIPWPTTRPGSVSDMEMEIELVCDDGHWWAEPQEASGTVTVANTGIVHVWPSIRWAGAGGEMTLPSGATATLPSVTSARTVRLDPDESLAVVDDSGTLDRPVWKQISAALLPEGIPPDASRTFHLPSGAALQWRIGVDAPW